MVPHHPLGGQVQVLVAHDVVPVEYAPGLLTLICIAIFSGIQALVMFRTALRLKS